MKPKRSKTWDMKWHWLREKEVLDHLIVYSDRGTNNDADYFTKRHPPIHHHQMRPRTSNLARTISHTIRLCEGVLNQVLGTKSRVDSLKAIQAEPQYMNDKCHTVRRINHPRQKIIYLINLSSYF